MGIEIAVAVLLLSQQDVAPYTSGKMILSHMRDRVACGPTSAYGQ